MASRSALWLPLVGLLWCAGCSASVRNAVPFAACRGDTPTAVVQAYYAAAVRHDAQAAQACLTPAERDRMQNADEPEWQTLKAIELTRIEEQPVHSNSGFRDIPLSAQIMLVNVNYVARWQHSMTETEGPGGRLMYVVRESKSAPWRIASSGTGP